MPNRPFSNLLKKYLHFLKNKPAQTKILTGGFIVCSGDIVAQQIIEEKYDFKKHDFQRSFRLFLVGVLLIAPFNYTWLDKVLPKVTAFTPKSTKNSILKVLLDQSIAAPIACSLYIAGNAVTNKQDPKKNVEEKLFSTVQYFWMLWCPIQFINFRFVPQMFNMPVVQVTNFLWTSFLSYLDNTKSRQE